MNDPRQDIIETITNLFIGTDERDWARVRACFATRVLFDMTSLTGGEPATLTPQQITDSAYEFHLANAVGRWVIDRFKFNLKFIDEK